MPAAPVAAPTPDLCLPALRLRRLGADVVIAVLAGTVVALLGWKLIHTVGWPAFPSSNVTRTLTTLGQAVCVAFLAGAAWLSHRGRWRRLAETVAMAGSAALVTVTLALPLGGSTLYLGGISVDQQFRTEYLTRLTSSPRLADMTYIDLPPFYSPGWFWLGGRFAALTAMPGWAAFQPWAILSLAVATAVACALWLAITTGVRAIAATLATAVLMLMYGSPEPYGAVLIMLLPPMLVVAWWAVTRGGRTAIIATGLFLGLAVWLYTLYLAVAALTVLLMGAVALIRVGRAGGAERTRIPLRVLGIGLIAIVLALPAYGPFLLAALTTSTDGSGSAFHYLPAQGSVLALPMLHFTLYGLLSLIGVIWILVRWRTSLAAQALGLGVAGVYLWALLSMLATLAGTTLLGFRTEPVLHVLLAAAGALAAVDLVAAGTAAGFERVRVTGVVLAAVAALGVAQTVPGHLSGEIDTAYTDTDGAGHRADQRPPGAEAFYGEVDAAIGRLSGRPRSENIVLTADYGLLAVYPYWGFQSLTGNYANPLAQFGKRSAAIEAWAALDSPAALIDALDRAAWPAPNVFVFRGDGERLTLRLAADVYPNDPNITRYTVAFPKSLFADPRFALEKVGPFTVVARK